MKIIMSAIYGFWIPSSFDQVLGSGLICQSGKNTLGSKIARGQSFPIVEIFRILEWKLRKNGDLGFIQSESI